MRTSLQLVDFKNFGDETLHMGPLTVIVGANASRKNNLRDAFRFLHGIGRGYTLSEIIGGKYGAGGQPEWAPIRGAVNEIVRFGREEFTLRVEAQGVDYSIRVGRSEERGGTFRVTSERLVTGSFFWDPTCTSHPGAGDPVQHQDDETHLLLRMGKAGTQRKLGDRIAVRPDRPALTQIREHRRVAKAHKEHAQKVIGLLASMRFLDLEPIA